MARGSDYVGTTGALLLSCAVAACGPQPDAPSRGGRPPSIRDVDESLSLRRAPSPSAGPAVVATSRNPFRFGQRSAPLAAAGRDLPPLPPPDGLPELPLPIVQPTVRLLGVAMDAGLGTAVLTIGSDLVLAKAGDLLGGRYRVEAVAESEVTLIDITSDRPLRLALR